MKTRKLNQKKCSECDKIGVWAKGLCQAHYSKMRRQTPEGAEGLRKYNETKGKLAQQRYLSKKPKKEPIEQKICECGKLSIAKGLCRNCYQNKRFNKNYTYKPKEKKVIDFTPFYKKVLNEVKKGNTIETACKNTNINRGLFYRKITAIQKKEINSYKLIGKDSDFDDFDDFL
jgi:hypothetical protein